MTTWERATDSPDRSVAEHVRRYLATDGADGFHEGGSTNLVLTTVGRRTGTPRRTGVFFGVDGDRYVLVASGAALGSKPPQWFHNLVANPEVRVQVRAERFGARARVATGDERERLWRLMTRQAPVFLRYEAAVDHEIPIVVLERG